MRTCIKIMIVLSLLAPASCVVAPYPDGNGYYYDDYRGYPDYYWYNRPDYDGRYRDRDRGEGHERREHEEHERH